MPKNSAIGYYNLKLHRMHSKYNNMHKNRIFHASICINNHAITSISLMLSRCPPSPTLPLCYSPSSHHFSPPPLPSPLSSHAYVHGLVRGRNFSPPHAYVRVHIGGKKGFSPPPLSRDEKNFRHMHEPLPLLYCARMCTRKGEEEILPLSSLPLLYLTPLFLLRRPSSFPHARMHTRLRERRKRIFLPLPIIAKKKFSHCAFFFLYSIFWVLRSISLPKF